MCVCVCVCVRACVCVFTEHETHSTNCKTVYANVMRFRLVPLHALQTRVTAITEHFCFQAFV